MSVTAQISPVSTPVLKSIPSTAEMAVSRCDKAYRRAQRAAVAEGKGQVSAMLSGEEAYRIAMPPLSGDENIRDFIACTAHGMLIDAISGADAARLLYAARVAHTTLRHRLDS